MERDERERADALDRQWDALLRGEVTATTADLDADLAALVARLQAAGSAIPPLFPDSNQAWRELRQSAMPSAVPWMDREPPPPAWPHPNGQAHHIPQQRSVTPLPRREGGWVLAQLATAALLMVTLGVAFAAIRQQMPAARDDGRWAPALVRALEAAPGGVVDTPLVEATFTAEELPRGEKEAIYYRLTIPPAASLPYLGGPYCGCRSETVTTGVGVEVVQAGIYTLRLDAPLRVQRAGSTRPSEEIPAGTEVTLDPGDAVIYSDYAAPGAIRNAGNVPVTLIGVAIIATEGSGTPLPKAPTGVAATALTTTIASDWEAFPTGPLNVALRQVTLPPKTSVGPYQPVGLQAMQIVSGTIERNFLPAGDSTPRGQPLVHSMGTTIPFMRPSPGLREILANSSEKPADMIALLIEPDVITVQSLAG